MQLGLHWSWECDRFHLSSEAKVGLFANAYSQERADSVGGTGGFQSSAISHSGADLSAMFELSLLLRYRIASSLWLRAGYQYYGFSGLAIAPRQFGGYDAGGTVGLDGLSIGLELIR